MSKCDIRKKLIREKEKYKSLCDFKLFDEKLKGQRTKHLKIIEEKIEKLEEELRRQ